MNQDDKRSQMVFLRSCGRRNSGMFGCFGARGHKEKKINATSDIISGQPCTTTIQNKCSAIANAYRSIRRARQFAESNRRKIGFKNDNE